jgi:hypothetical protein
MKYALFYMYYLSILFVDKKEKIISLDVQLQME